MSTIVWATREGRKLLSDAGERDGQFIFLNEVHQLLRRLASIFVPCILTGIREFGIGFQDGHHQTEEGLLISSVDMSADHILGQFFLGTDGIVDEVFEKTSDELYLFVILVGARIDQLTSALGQFLTSLCREFTFLSHIEEGFIRNHVPFLLGHHLGIKFFVTHHNVWDYMFNVYIRG